MFFSRRFSSEKCPTLTVASFFLFFFVRPQTSSRMYHFLQKLIKLLRPSPANANLVQRVPLLFLTFLRNLQNQKRLKGPPFQFFFGTLRLFSKIFCLKRVPLSSFLMFCNRIYVNKAQRVPLFTFFGTMRHFLEKNDQKFQVFFEKCHLRFLSLRYSAVFRR